MAMPFAEVNQKAKCMLDLNNESIGNAVNAAKALFSGVNASAKTPISLLQEIGTKCSLHPAYEQIGLEGEVYMPIYVYKVSLGTAGLVAFGKGTSKKRAKHMAAFGMLNEIKQQSIGKNDSLAMDIEHLIQMMKLAENNDTCSSVDEKDPSKLPNDQIRLTTWNPVGELLEITQKHSMRPPVFEYGPEEGPAHNRSFSCIITFGEHKETGVGRSKKEAKRQASIKLLNEIKKWNIDTNSSKNRAAQPLQQVKDQKRLVKNIQNSFNSFKNSDKPIIRSLIANEIPDEKNSEFNSKLLFELCEEQKFQLAYIQVPSISLTGKKNIVLQLKVHPEIVIIGSGATIEDAKKNADYSALLYIKSMCS